MSKIICLLATARNVIGGILGVLGCAFWFARMGFFGYTPAGRSDTISP